MYKATISLRGRQGRAWAVLQAIIRPGAETSGLGEKDDPEALSEAEQAQVAQLRHKTADLKARMKQLRAGFFVGSKIGHL